MGMQLKYVEATKSRKAMVHVRGSRKMRRCRINLMNFASKDLRWLILARKVALSRIEGLKAHKSPSM